MTAALGVTRCNVLGCRRERHVSPSGITYGRCLAHTLTVLSGAFGPQQNSEAGGVPPRAFGFGVLPRVVPAPRPAA